MADKDLVKSAGDELSGEVALRASLDKTGLTVAGQSRALAAADRLLGGLIGIPAAYFEGVRSRAELRNSTKAELLRIEGERAIELVKSVEGLGRRTAERFVIEETRKQVNREAVWVETQEALKSLPPPAAFEPADEAPELDDDWINLFSRYAEIASGERLRVLWGRILAGEIRKPGAFAPTTLRVISEMDSEIATAFQEALSLRLPFGILKPDKLAGDLFLKLVMLEEVGLLQGTTGLGGLSYNLSGSPPEYHILRTNNYYLKVSFSKPEQLVAISMIKITRVGQQIAEILPWDEKASLRACADFLFKAKDVGLELGKIGRTVGPNQFETLDVEIIYQLPASP